MDCVTFKVSQPILLWILIGKPLFPFSFRAIDIYRPAIVATLLFELVNAYEIYFVRRLNKFLNQSDISPIEKLQNFVNDAGEKLQKYDFKRGCILGNLGQEVSYLAPEIIARIESIFQVWEKMVSDCLHEFYAQYSLSDCNDMAYQFWIGWEGAVLRARLTKSTRPLEAFYRLFTLGVEQFNSVKN